MNKAIKWGLIICASLVVLVVAILIIAPAFIDIRDYKPQLEEKVAEATGRPFSVGDDLSLSLFPWAGISFSDLRLGNTPGFSEKDLVTVKSFEVRVKLLPLISKDIQIKRFILNEPNITLVKNKNGQVNWAQPDDAKKKSAAEKTAKASKSEEAAAGLPIKDLTVGEFSIKNGSILWIDHTANTRKEITAVNLKLKDVSLERPVTLSFAALLDNKPLSIDGTVGPVGKDFKQATIPLDLNLKALTELALKLNGQVMNPGSNPSFDLTVDIKTFSPRKLSAALGQDFPVATADPKVLDRVALKASVKGSQTKVSISNGMMNLDESTLKFSLNASDFSRPNLAFKMNLDRIDLDRYLPPGSDKPPAAGKPVEKKPTDYTPLRKLILDGEIKIGQLVVSKAKIEDMIVHVIAKNGIINLNPLKLNMYQGNVSGIGKLNVQQDTPRTNVNLDVKNIQAGPLLKDVLEKDILEGITNAQVTLSMAGDGAAAIKKTLNGSGQIRFTDGAIIGIDLAGMIRNVKSAFGLEQKPAQRPRTDFAELNAPFSIKQGNVHTPQTSLKSPLIRVIAAGDAHLVKETLDFRVEPKVVGTIKGQGDTEQRSGLMVPVLVTGTFSNPRFAPDLAGMAKKQLEETILGSGEDGQKMDKESLEESAKGLLKGILGD
jgi:AsmA protein